MDNREAVNNSKVSTMCVGTPGNDNRSLDLSHIKRVCGEIGGHLWENDYHVIVMRSTTLPGSTEREVIPALEKAFGNKAGIDFGICVNPEILWEGKSVFDYQTAKLADTRKYSLYFKAMLAQRVYLPPSQFEAMFLSLAHTEEDIEKTIQANRYSLKVLKET